MKRQWLFECFRARPLPVAQARRRRHGQRGVTALEFAIVGPLAIFVLMFTIEIAVLLMADALLGRVSNHIGRVAQLEQLNSADCAGDIRSRLLAGMKGFVFKPETVVVERVAIFTSAAPAPAPGTGFGIPLKCADNGAAAGSSLVYKVGFSSPGLTGVFGVFGIQILRFERRILVQNGPA